MIRKIILILILVVGGAILFVALNRMGTKPSPVSSLPNEDEGQTMQQPTPKGISVTVRNEQTRKIEYVIKGEDYFQKEDKSYDITNPKINIYRENIQTEITSDKGNFFSTKQEGEQIKNVQEGWLTGNVVVKTDDKKGTKTVLTTDKLFWRKQDNYIHIPESLVIENKDLLVTGENLESVGRLTDVTIKKNVKVVLKNAQNATAASQNPETTPTGEQLTITCDNDMQFAGRTIVFNNNVKAESDDYILTAEDTLQLFLNSKSGSSNNTSASQLYKIKATKNVHLLTTSQDCMGNVLEYYPAKGTGIITGRPAKVVDGENFIAAATIRLLSENTGPTKFLFGANHVVAQGKGTLYIEASKDVDTMDNGNSKSASTAPTTIEIEWEDHMVFYPDKNMAVFFKNVVAKQNYQILKGDMINVSFASAENAAGPSDVQRIFARNNIWIDQSEQILTGDTFNYDRQTDLALLDGSVDKPAMINFQDGSILKSTQIQFMPQTKTLAGTGTGYLYVIMTGQNSPEKSSFIEATWDKNFLFDDAKSVVNFYENVHVIQDNDKLVCDELQLNLGKDSLFGDVEKVIAKNNVTINTSTMNAKGDIWIYERAVDKNTIIGTPFAEVEQIGSREGYIHSPEITFYSNQQDFAGSGPGEVVFYTGSSLLSNTSQSTPEKMIIRYGKSIAYNGTDLSLAFEKDVLVKRAKETLTCQKLEVFFKKAEVNGEMTVDELIATGDAHLVSVKNEARGDKIRWHVPKNEGVVTGDLAQVLIDGRQSLGREYEFYQTENGLDFKVVTGIITIRP